MHHRPLGSSGLLVSAITFGNWLTHGSQVDRKNAIACVEAALDAGITTFDTADFYAGGEAERVLGAALASERRSSLEVLTKVYYPVPPMGPNDAGLSRKHIMEGIDASLRRLNMDYVDVYQAHRWDASTPLEETMVAFADVVRSGKALYIGVSEWTAAQITEAAALAAELRVPFISNQPQYSALWRIIEAEVVPASEAAGLSQIVWSPLAQGVLSGKYRPDAPPPAGSRATDSRGGSAMIGRFYRPEVLTAVQRLRPIADELGVTMAQLSLAWVLGGRNVASAIIGASRPEQIAENVRALELTLDDDLRVRIDEALAAVAVTDPALTAGESPALRPQTV